MGLLVSDHSLRVSTARRPTRAMVKHNNLLPNGHFKKFWQLRVRTWFDQAGQKKRRRLARKEKAQAVFPRPAAGALRPVVRAPTNKYNRKLRAGRGFTFAELAEAGGARHGQDWSAEERRIRHGCTRPRRCPFGWCARQEGRSGGGEEEASIVMRLNRPVCVSGLTRRCEVNNTKNK